MRTIGYALLALLACGAAAALAQAPMETAGGGARLGWDEILLQGGWVLKVIFVVSVLGVAAILYLLYVLRQDQVAPRAMLQDLLARIGEGDLNEARLVCNHKPCPLGAVALSAIDYVQSVKKFDGGVLKDVMESEGKRQAAALQNPTYYLLDIAAIAPMIGLLGTVIGMLHAFKGVAAEIAQARPAILAGGVSMALITTVAGLLVGIPATAFYALFRGWSTRQIARLEASAMELMTALLRQGD